MKQILLILILCMALVSCDNSCCEEGRYVLEGAWTLQKAKSPSGGIYEFPQTTRYMLVYVGDSMLSQCEMTRSEDAITLSPTGKSSVTLIDVGGGNWVYMEDDGPHPLTIENDSTIVIQRNGTRYTWQREPDIYEEWSEDIQRIAESELKQASDNYERHSYVLSSIERKQKHVIHWFIGSAVLLFIIMCIIVHVALINRREKRRLLMQLQQIKEEHDERPQPVRQALNEVATAYFGSDEYHALLHLITSGQRLKEDDWNEIETQLKKVYPGFCNQLRTLYSMSELEYQVCLLIKLRIAPTDIATVLMRDASTISTVRSRLYKKVFGKKGGSKEWDEFVMSIGT